MKLNQIIFISIFSFVSMSVLGQGHNQRYISKKIKGKWMKISSESCFTTNSSDSATTSFLTASKVIIGKSVIKFFDNDKLIDEYKYELRRDVNPGSFTYYLVFDLARLEVKTGKNRLFLNTCCSRCDHKDKLIVKYTPL